MPGSVRPADLVDDWQLQTIPSLAGGLVTSIPAHLIDPEQLSACTNYAIRDGALEVDLGYVRRGVNTTIRGTSGKSFQHESAAGAITLLLVTTATVYVYVPSVDEWHYPADDVKETTLSGNEAGGQTVLSVVDETIVAPGDFVGIILDDGTQHQTTVAGVAAGEITVDDALPSAASTGNSVVKAVDLNGVDSSQIVFAPIPNQEWSAFTNGVDFPMYFDGSRVSLIPNLPSSGNIICKTMALMLDSNLVLGGLVQAGTSRPYKLIWCADGDPTDWDPTAGAGAGENNLLDSRDDIVALAMLGRAMIVYRTSSAVRMTLGAGVDKFDFEPVISGESVRTQGLGAVSPNAVFAATDEHFVFGPVGFYRYRGGRAIEFIDRDTVSSSALGLTSEAERSELPTAFVAYLDRLDEVWFVFSDEVSVLPTVAYVYNRKRGVWWRRKFANPISSAGLRTEGDTVRIIDLVGTILEQNWIIGVGPGEGSVRRSFMLVGVGEVFEYDLSTPDEDGETIEASCVTKEFRSEDRYGRFAMLEVISSGRAITITAETPSRTISIGSTPDSSVPVRSRFYPDFVDQAVRFRFESMGRSRIEQFSYEAREESRWSL